MKLPPIPRPDGSVYRPRAIRTQMLGNEDEITGVVVFGTTDIREAEAAARLDVKAVDRELYDEFTELALVGEPQAQWLSRSLAGWDEGHPIYVYTVSKQGAYALTWQVREQDRTRDPEPHDAQELALFNLGPLDSGLSA